MLCLLNCQIRYLNSLNGTWKWFCIKEISRLFAIMWFIKCKEIFVDKMFYLNIQLSIKFFFGTNTYKTLNLLVWAPQDSALGFVIDYFVFKWVRKCTNWILGNFKNYTFRIKKKNKNGLDYHELVVKKVLRRGLILSPTLEILENFRTSNYINSYGV